MSCFRLALASIIITAPVAGDGFCASTQTQIRFTDVSTAAGINGDEYRSPSGHSLGVNWIDFNADGWPDLFVVGGGPGYPPHLFRNDGNGTFSRVDTFLPILPDVEMSGSRFADYDRDGDQDIFIYTDHEDWRLASRSNFPDGPPNILLRNLWIENGAQVLPGQPLFEDVAAAAGVDDLAQPALGDLPAFRSKTAAWFDYNRDGCIDLFVGHQVINAGGMAANKDRFYRNLCNGSFTDVTASSGINPGIDPSSYRAALASGGFHLNADLWPDLYVINVSYSDPQPYLNDLIYINNGLAANGTVTFNEISAQLPGVGDDAQAGMGVDVADVDLDGNWDVYITDIFNTLLDEQPLGNVLYLGNGANGFSDNFAATAGVQGENSWGVNFFDADHDGWEDLYVATIAGTETELFYHNNGTSGQGHVSFTNIASEAGFVTGNSRGSAVADYDRDGDLDIALVNQNGPLQLFRNDTVTSGHWLALELRGSASNTDAIGTIVEASSGGLTRRRQVKGGSSAHSQDSLTVHFGLGAATVVDQIRIRWPSGYETILNEVPADQYIQVTESLLVRETFE